MNLLTPQKLKEKYPLTKTLSKSIQQKRNQINKVINKESDKLLVIVGPCSIHNVEQALEYATRLKEMADRHHEYLVIVMRVYLEKPRTSIGWKGFIHDPDLSGKCRIDQGLEKSRELLIKINEIGLPCATEFLDILTPHYLAELVSWGCIGARTTESQTHRQMASNLPMAIGFKNGTTGSIKIAIDGIITARDSHSYLGISDSGQVSVVHTHGNPNSHIVLRGGWDGPNPKPNYYSEDIQHVSQLLQYSGLLESIVIDCSHGNSKKNHKNQPKVAHYLSEQISKGNQNIVGVMIESNIHEGKQPFSCNPKYGISITDGCLSLEQTEEVLEELAIAVKNRRYED